MPHSHQPLNTFKSCLVKQFKIVSSIIAAFGFLSTTDFTDLCSPHLSYGMLCPDLSGNPLLSILLRES